MSNLSGKLSKLTELKGAIKKHTPEFRGRLEKVEQSPRVSIALVPGFSGAWSRAGRFFNGVARPLDILYRFIAARRQIQVELKAKPGTAPAQEIQADSAITTSVAASAAARPAVEVTVDSQPFVSVRARLAAYRRATAVYISGIFLARTAKLSAAPGVATRYCKVMKLERVSKAEAAPGAIVESRFNQVPTGAEAAPATAPTKETAIETAFIVESGASAVAAPAQDVSIRCTIGFALKAAPHPWFLPEFADGTLYLFQVFSGVQSGNSVEIDMDAESVYWANALVKDGVMDLTFAATAAQTDNILEVV